MRVTMQNRKQGCDPLSRTVGKSIACHSMKRIHWHNCISFCAESPPIPRTFSSIFNPLPPRASITSSLALQWLLQRNLVYSDISEIDLIDSHRGSSKAGTNETCSSQYCERMKNLEVSIARALFGGKTALKWYLCAAAWLPCHPVL